MTALFESFSLTIILDVFSLSIPTLLHFSWVGKPVLDRELLYEIHGYGIPRLLGNRKLLEKSVGFVAHRFGMGTSGARFAVVFDVDWKSGPIVLHMDLM